MGKMKPKILPFKLYMIISKTISCPESLTKTRVVMVTPNTMLTILVWLSERSGGLWAWLLMLGKTGCSRLIWIFWTRLDSFLASINVLIFFKTDPMMVIDPVVRTKILQNIGILTILWYNVPKSVKRLFLKVTLQLSGTNWGRIGHEMWNYWGHIL